MDARDYKDLFQSLMLSYCMAAENVIFVDDVAEWCRREGIEERDRRKPLKIVPTRSEGCKLLVSESISAETITERINALRIRSALVNVASNRADALNSYKKRLAYLFLSEYASTLPDLRDDEQLADEWAFSELDRQGFFRE
jgi:hypothetical protein